ncbi:MAG: penicillin-binding transpeptidase domain-containing protein, partial [Candidatus Pacebacteria bacterium]|nr:penicillin-binding transpeptidase domain-containing protein [Candidatus Paceibacterota bacterium]
AYYQDVRDGMRLGVTAGTVQGLSMPQVAIAAKTGTAEQGTQKQYVNSWVTGFYPYQSPDYAFVLLLEHGPAHYASGAPATMRTVMEWMSVNTPEYLK